MTLWGQTRFFLLFWLTERLEYKFSYSLRWVMGVFVCSRTQTSSQLKEKSRMSNSVSPGWIWLTNSKTKEVNRTIFWHLLLCQNFKNDFWTMGIFVLRSHSVLLQFSVMFILGLPLLSLSFIFTAHRWFVLLMQSLGVIFLIFLYLTRYCIFAIKV